MSREELGHGEGPDAFGSEDLGHLLVGGEELLVLGILQVVLLQVGPELFHALGSGGLFLPDDVGEFGRELHGLGQSCSFSRHGC